jgi:photosystem II stability/assembly factor-like uncharacterized protein
MKIISHIIPLLLLSSSCNHDNNNHSNWKELSTYTDKTVTQLCFSNDNFGVGLVSIGSIIRTTDAGNNWYEINVVTDENFTSCFALTNTEVFVGRNRFFKSTDGGDSFTELGQNQINYSSSIFAIHFFNKELGVIVKGGSVYKTTDGGSNWLAKYPQYGFANHLEVIKNQTLYIAGGNTYDNITFGEMHKSDDLGETWIKLSLPNEIQQSEITSIDFLTHEIGNEFQYGGIRDIALENGNTGYLTTNNSIYKTTNGGISWLLHHQSTSELYYFEKTTNNIFVHGRHGVILRKE